MDQELREYLDSRFEHIRQGLDQTNQRLDQTNQRLDQTNQRLGSLEDQGRGLEDQGRQTQVVVEDLRGQVAIVAEGVVGLGERQDLLRDEMRGELREFRQLFGVTYTHIDRRLGRLESS